MSDYRLGGWFTALLTLKTHSLDVYVRTLLMLVITEHKYVVSRAAGGIPVLKIQSIQP